MNSKRALLFLVVSTVLSFSSCSGLKGACTVNCGGGGNGTATLTITMRATPLTPPASTNLLAFVTQITGVTLTPSSGNPVNFTSTPTLDFIHLQDSSLLLGTVTAPAGSYTSITIAFSAPKVTYCTQLSGVAGCALGSVAYAPSGVTLPVIPVTLSLSENQQAGLEIDLDLNKALTVNANTQVITAVNLGDVSAFSTSALPPTSSSLAAGQLDFFENILGEVTAVSGQAVTVQTAANGSYTATGSASTYYSPNCLLSSAACSPAVGQLVSIDTAVNDNGTLALLVYDPLSSAAIGWIDGVVTAPATSSTQFQIIAGKQITSAGGSYSLPGGSLVNVTLATPLASTFLIDAKGLTLPNNSFTGSTDASVLVPGMTVGLRVTQFTAASGATPAAITADIVTLRFSSVSGTISAAAAPISFTMQSLPTFFGPTTSSVVQLNQLTPTTNYDGVSGSSGLTVGDTAAIRALYLGSTSATNTPFIAAKVRQF